jgi:hypothetical protein
MSVTSKVHEINLSVETRTEGVNYSKKTRKITKIANKTLGKEIYTGIKPFLFLLPHPYHLPIT